ncbi:MAG: hypothetical protein JO134_04760 [Xanthobacteraceae bacterium]|nr:hypothetical protein [Xanthobacteraceae bacterium]
MSTIAAVPRAKAARHAKANPTHRQFAVAPHLAGKIKPFDVTAPTPTGPTVGVQFLSFSYIDTGGTNNLLPGREVTQTTALTWPPGAGYAVVMMRGFGAAFVDENDNLTDHHLGDIVIEFFFQDSNTIACNFLLRDQGIDEGVNMWSEGLVLYFQGG